MRPGFFRTVFTRRPRDEDASGITRRIDTAARSLQEAAKRLETTISETLERSDKLREKARGDAK